MPLVRRVLFEEFLAQSAEGLLLVGFLHEEGDVEVAAAIGNHAYGNRREGFAYERFETYVAPLEVTYDADDAHVLVHFHGSVLFPWSIWAMMQKLRMCFM